MREYATLKSLRAGETIRIDGFLVRMIEGEVGPGDAYVAERNTGPKLLVAADPKDHPGIYARSRFNPEGVFAGGGCIFADPPWSAYPYDTHECIKIEILAIDEGSPTP